MGIKEFFDKLFRKKGTMETETAPGEIRHGHTEEQGTKREPKVKNEKGDSLVCVDCGSSFVFLPGEQKFFKERGLTPPKRCPSCRAKRKEKRNR